MPSQAWLGYRRRTGIFKHVMELRAKVALEYELIFVELELEAFTELEL